MTNGFVVLAVTAYVSLVSGISAMAADQRTCAALLQSQRSISESLPQLTAVPADSKSRAELIWLAPSLSVAKMQELQNSARALGLRMSFDDFFANKNQVIGHFRIRGTAGQILDFAQTLNEKGDFRVTELVTAELEKIPTRPWEQVNADLESASFSVLPYTLGSSGDEHELVVIRLKNDAYMAPRLAYVFEHEDLYVVNLGTLEDLPSALARWRAGSPARVRIGSSIYLIADYEILESIRSVKKADFLAAGLTPDLPINQWLRKRYKTQPPPPPAEKVAPSAPPVMAPIKTPLQYGSTEWHMGKFRSLFESGAAGRGSPRPFSIVRWSTVPAWAVVNITYLQDFGIEATLAGLEAWVPVPLRRAVRTQLENFVRDPGAFAVLPHTRLGGTGGKTLLNKLLEEDLIQVFAKRDEPENSVVVFPLGNVRTVEQEDPPAKARPEQPPAPDEDVPPVTRVTPDPLNSSLRERPVARIIFAPGTGYQSKLTDLNEFEDQVLAAAKEIPGEGNVAIEQENQDQIERYHVTYRSQPQDPTAPVEILQLRRLDDQEIVPTRLEFDPSSRADSILSDREAFKERLFKIVNSAVPSPVDFEILETLVHQYYQGHHESVRVRFTEKSGAITVHEVVVQRPRDRDDFYHRFATYHQISGGTFAHELPDISVGTKRVAAIVIPPYVRARNSLEYDITPEMESQILSEVKVAARSANSSSFRARVRLKGRDFVVSLGMRSRTAILREIYPAN